MPGKPGRTGVKNATFLGGAVPVPAAKGVDPGEWPWERARSTWTYEKIRKHMIAFCAERGLVTSDRERDLVNSLAAAHFARHSAMRAISESQKMAGPDDGPADPMVGRQCAFRAWRAADTQIIKVWSELGVKSGAKVGEDSEQADRDAEFLAQFEDPSKRESPSIREH